MTLIMVSAISARVGRKRINAEFMSARFREGTFVRIDAHRIPHESRADFIRKAVEAELDRRDADMPPPITPKKRQRRERIPE